MLANPAALANKDLRLDEIHCRHAAAAAAAGVVQYGNARAHASAVQLRAASDNSAGDFALAHIALIES